MANDEQSGDNDYDGENGPDTDGYDSAGEFGPAWGMMSPWVAAMMGFPGAPPPGPYGEPWGQPQAAWLGRWGPPPPSWMASAPSPMTASLQACDALLYWIASRADFWQHLFATCAEATANAARTNRSLWDRGPHYPGLHWLESPKSWERLVTALGALQPDQAARVLYDVVSLRILEAMRHGNGREAAGKDTGSEIDLQKLREALRDLPEHQQEQVVHAVKAGQQLRRRSRTAPRTDSGHDR